MSLREGQPQPTQPNPKEIIRPLRSGARIAVTTDQPVKLEAIILAVSNLLRNSEDFLQADLPEPNYDRRIRVQDEDGNLIQECVIEGKKKTLFEKKTEERTATLDLFSHKDSEHSSQGEQAQKVGEAYSPGEQRIDELKQRLGAASKGYECYISIVNSVIPTTTTRRVIYPDKAYVVLEAADGRTGYGESNAVYQPPAAFEASKAAGFRRTATSISNPGDSFDPWSLRSGARITGPKAMDLAITTAWCNLFGQESAERTSYPSIFMSYSSENDQFIRTLYDILDKHHINVWLAPTRLRPAERFRETIEAAVKQQDLFLVVISEASIKSQWVAKEIQLARDEGKTIVPIVINGCLNSNRLPEWAQQLKDSVHIGSFPANEGNPDYYDRFDESVASLLQVLTREQEVSS